ncbi:MAG: T9SS type A sorting domain-containing protein [Armatimonadetes bacterium]|nr:T9SS type A sorting domain-containing protein [Armatimonadota bacterium]
MKKIVLFTLILIPFFLFSQIHWQDNGVPVRCGENVNWTGTTITAADGNFVLIWSDSRNIDRGIFAQKITPEGILLWDEEGIEINDETDSQHNPQAIATDNNEIIIAWHCVYSVNEKEVRIQKIDASGNKLWADEGVSVIVDSEIDYDIHIIEDQNGGAFVLWQDPYDFSQLKGMHVLSDGSLDSNWNPSGNIIISYYSPSALFIEALPDVNGGFIISCVHGFDLCIQRIDSSGNLLWGDDGIILCEGTVYNDYVSVTSDNNGIFYFFWIDSRNSNTNVIYMQKVDIDGNILFEEDVLIYTPAGNISKIFSTYTSDDNLAICWKESDYNQQSLRTLKLDTFGNPLWDPVIATENEITFYNDGMMPDGNGGYWLKWFCFGNYKEFYVQHINESGFITLTANGFLICEENGYRNNMAINLTSDNRAFLSWHDTRYGTSSLYVQIVDEVGNLQFSENGLVVYEGSIGYCKDLRIIPNNDNPIFIWVDQNFYFDQRIFMQSLNADGSLVFDENGIFLLQADFNIFSDFDLDHQNENYTIISRKYTPEGITKAIAQSFDNAGNLLWGEGIFVSNSDWHQDNVQISSHEGVIYTGWSEYNCSWSVLDIFAQKLDENGNLLWDEAGVLITDRDGEDYLHDIVDRCYIWRNGSWPNYDIYAKLVDENGSTAPGWEENGTAICQTNSMNNYSTGYHIPQGYLIIWQASVDSQRDIYGQIITEEGDILWQQNGLPLVAQPGDQQNFSFQFDDYLYLVWQDYRSGNDYEIYAQKFDENGNELWQTGGVLIGDGGNPDIAKIGNRLFVVWEKDGENDFNDIYAQLISLEGEILWNPEGIVLCDAFWEQRNPQIVTNETNDVYIGWLDERVFNYNLEGGDHVPSVFAQKIHIEPTYSPDEILNAFKAKLHQNNPNPFNPETKIIFDLPEAGRVKLEIYNIKGQKVKTLLDCHMNQGRSELIWNGRDENDQSVSSGVYFYRLKAGNFEKSKKMVLLK